MQTSKKKGPMSTLPQLEPSWQLDKPLNEYITCMEWSLVDQYPDPILVMGLANGELVLLNAKTKQVLHREVEAHQDGLLSVLIVDRITNREETNNEKSILHHYIICGSQDGFISLWKLQKRLDDGIQLTKLDQHQVDGGKWIESMVWMTGRKRLAVASSNQVQTFTIQENQLVVKRINNAFKSTVSCLAWNQRTLSLAISSYGNILITDSVLNSKLNINIKGSFQMLSFSSDGRYCVCGMLESMAIILNTENQQVVPLSLPKKPSIIRWLTDSSQTIAISSNSSVVVLKSIPLVELYMSEMDEEDMDDEVRELLSDNEFGFMHPGPVTALEFVPGQYRKPWIVSACSKGLIRLTDYENGRVVAFLPMGEERGVSSMKFNQDFKTCQDPVLIVGYSDGSLSEIPLSFK